jgi:hypothetical protein
VFTADWFLALALAPVRAFDRFLRRPTKAGADPRPWFIAVVVTPILVADHLIPRSRFAAADEFAPGENEMVCASCGYRVPL